MPDDALIEAWCLACRRGVHLRVVVPQRSNHRLARLGARARVARLGAGGGQRYFAPPTWCMPRWWWWTTAWGCADRPTSTGAACS
ncbi:hypothetical protein [Comamonas sp. JC664]|uniref:hypothetical protein n=1 Tax=Comamonas sp. JC664 TaxID=2801917 RepID=UPI0036706AA1